MQSAWFFKNCALKFTFHSKPKISLKDKLHQICKKNLTRTCRTKISHFIFIFLFFILALLCLLLCLLTYLFISIFLLLFYTLSKKYIFYSLISTRLCTHFIVGYEWFTIHPNRYVKSHKFFFLLPRNL